MLMKLRAGDFVVCAAVLAAAALIWLYPLFAPSDAEVAVISQNGAEIERVSLKGDEKIELSGCVVRTEGGEVFMESSDCPDGVCIKTGRVSKKGESIICVPNRVSVIIEGSGEVDIIT